MGVADKIILWVPALYEETWMNMQTAEWYYTPNVFQIQ